MNRSPTPPKWADYLLEWFCAPHLLEEVQGDLHERYYKQMKEVGAKKASRVYIANVLSFMRPFIYKRQPDKYPPPNFSDMFQSYLTIALRSMKRNKVYSFINITGLSVGLACCMLIFLYTKDEVSYDSFHEKKDRIFRVSVITTNEKMEESKMGSTNMIVGPSFKQAIPEIETFVRMQSGFYVIRAGTELFNQEVLFADEDFFSAFSFPLLTGNPKEVLADINGVVLSEEMAEKYFGTTHVIGKTIELELSGKFEPFIVSGIARNPPQNSSVQFGIIFPYKYNAQKYPDTEWLGFYINTFVVLHPHADYRTVAPKLDQVFLKNAKEERKRAEEQGYKGSLHFGLQPLSQIHLGTEYGDIRNGLADGSNSIYSYILSGIAIFILVIACINFVNLTTAHSLKRGKEIGIRKVVGGQRSQLIRQFLSESFICCLMAFVLAILLVQLALPVFNELANKRLSFSYLLDIKLVIAYLALFCLTGLTAGFYPALVLSGFNPVQTLYNRHTFTDKNYLTKGLVVVQFALATFLIITTIVVYTQFNYLTHKDLGYNDENVVTVSLGRRADEKLVGLLKEELAKVPSLERVGAKNPGQNYTLGEIDGKEIGFAISWIDENYLPALQIPLVNGRNFSKDFPSDAENSIIVNETFVKEAGWKEPIGKTVFNVNGKQKPMTVVGIVKDHHYVSLKEKIGAQLFQVGGGNLWIKVKPGQVAHSMQAIEKIYRKIVPFRPFEYEFMNVINEKNYEEEAKWKQIITYGAVLTILISCIGLFGLTILSTERRTKEIGIRKVFGASVGQIVTLLSTNFLQLVAMAFLIAIPLAWYATHKWLENFAYQIDVSWWIFALSGILTLLIALCTISFQAIKAALVNPVKSLRNE